MTEERTCCICMKRPYMRERVCDPCRDRLPRTLTDIADLHAQLPDALARDQANSQRVTGSREAPVPVNIDAIDLGAAPRLGGVHDTMVPATTIEPVEVKRRYYAIIDGEPVEVEETYEAWQRRLVPKQYVPAGDQIGYIEVASILDEAVHDWRDEMTFAQSLPAPTVPELVRWLSDRCEWACDRHPAVDDFASEMGRLRAVLRGVLGLLDPPAEFCDGVVCRKCDRYALYREADYVECDHCGLLYSEREYQEWAALIGGQAHCPICDERVSKAARDRWPGGIWRVTHYPCGHTIERMMAA